VVAPPRWPPPASGSGASLDHYQSLAPPERHPSRSTRQSANDETDFCIATGSTTVDGALFGAPTAVRQGQATVNYDTSLDGAPLIVAPGELVVPPISHLHISMTELEVSSN